MKCTMKDIAEVLQISRNTVSKALKGTPGVSDAMRQRIQEKAREMNYRYSISEQKPLLPNRIQGSVLFLTRASSNYSEFWTKVLRGIESVLTLHQYQLVLSIMSESDLKNLQFPPIIKDPGIKGIILVEICDEHVLNALFPIRLPMVTVDMPRDYESILGKLDIITMENKMNVKMLVNDLIQKGARRFAFAGDIYSSNVGRGFQERYDALCETLNAHGLQLDQKCSMLHETDHEFMDFTYMIDKVKKMTALPDVFLCGNDWTAVQLMHAIQFLGYKVPKDVSIAGFDNIPESAKVRPPLTTVDTPKEQLGIAAANCIVERISRPDIPCVYSQYSTSLILRESTV